MSAKLAAFIVAFLAVAAVGYYFVAVYPPVVLKRATQHALDAMRDAVESKDRTKVSAGLETFLTEESAVRLDVSFFSIIQQDGGSVHRQDFDRPGFVAFIDNLLYPSDDYGLYSAQIESFELSADRTAADIGFFAKVWADSLSYYGGTGVRMRYSADGDCKAHVLFMEKKAQFDKLQCKVMMRSVPRPEETAKMRDPKVLQEFLRQP